MKKTILHVLNSRDKNGAETVVILLICEMRRQFPDYHFVYSSPKGIISEYLNKNNIEYVPIKKMSIPEIRKLLHKTNPDLVHAHGYSASTICSLISGKVPVLSHLHGNPPWIRTINIRSLAYGLTSIRCGKVVCVSRAILDENYFRNCFQNKSIIIDNPIDRENILSLSEAYEEKSIYDVCFVGSFRQAKDPLRFITIINEINQIKNVKAVMLGDGNLREKAEKLISSYGLNDFIDVKGEVSNPFPIMKNSRLLFAPRKWEGFGLAIAEAMVLGLPVVATPVGSIPYMLGEKTETICSTDEEFKNIILKLLSDQEFYEKCRHRVLQKSQAFLSIEDYSNRINELYRDII